MNEDEKNAILLSYYRSIPHYEELAGQIRRLFEGDPSLDAKRYVLKHRIKREARLIEKIDEKNREADRPVVNRRNYQTKIEDILGMRIVCPRLSDIKKIDAFVSSLKKEGKIVFRKRENKRTFVLPIEPGEGFPKDVDFQYTGYSSVHYIAVRVGTALSPPEDISNLRAEIQLRTIFEEAWDELDHPYRYEAARRGAKIPVHISIGFYNLSAYLQAAALQAEHLCREADKVLAQERRGRRRAAAAALTGSQAPPTPTVATPAAAATIEEAVKTKFGFSPTPRTVTYIQGRLDDANILVNQAQRLDTEVLSDEAVSEFRGIFIGVMKREPFVESATPNNDLVNLVNYALFRRIQGREVAKEGLRSVLWERL